MTVQQSKWNAKAEAAMMGFVIEIESEEHLKHTIGYILHLITQQDDPGKVQEVFDSIHKFNSEETPVSHFTINRTEMGTLMTFVRDPDISDTHCSQGLTTPMGVLSYVYNIENPWCSELGYTFFRNVHGKLRRVG